MAKVELPTQRTLDQISTEPANIPVGVWELRVVKLTSKEVTKKASKDGEGEETVEHTLIVEPVKPTSSVSQEALAEVDERGKPIYEGKRIFCRFVELYRGDMAALKSALSAYGFGKEPLQGDERTVGDVARRLGTSNALRGRVAKGDVFDRTYPKNDGTQGIEQKVRSWAPIGASAAMAL